VQSWIFRNRVRLEAIYLHGRRPARPTPAPAPAPARIDPGLLIPLPRRARTVR
jgi:hypothetical protein